MPVCLRHNLCTLHSGMRDLRHSFCTMAGTGFVFRGTDCLFVGGDGITLTDELVIGTPGIVLLHHDADRRSTRIMSTADMTILVAIPPLDAGAVGAPSKTRKGLTTIRLLTGKEQLVPW
eukprot:m.1056079 g.1056079  ORF g.1056079 m.1056079 type:complete len:119 (+) comp24196_c1_seq19:2304-2660(+)